jgi:hypothetical protein
MSVTATQFGLDGKAAQTAIYYDNSKDCISTNCHFVDQKLGIIFDASEDCTSIGDKYYSSGNVTGGKHAVIINSSKRCRILDPVLGKATNVTVAFEIQAGCTDCEIRVGKVDMTNIGTLISNAGTRTRIRIDGPATPAILNDTGSDTYLWCEPTPYTAVLAAVTGSIGSAPAPTATYSQQGKEAIINVTGSITTIGSATGGIICTLPKAVNGDYYGEGRVLNTGARFKVYVLNGTADAFLRTDADAIPVTTGDSFSFSLSVRF